MKDVRLLVPSLASRNPNSSGGIPSESRRNPGTGRLFCLFLSILFTLLGSQAAYAQSLSLDKEGSGEHSDVSDHDYDSVGELLTYTYTVTNDDPVVILAGPVTIDDDTATVKVCPFLFSVGNGDDNLDPGETIVCEGIHRVIQADLDAGFVTNIATASVDGTTSPSDTLTLTVEPLGLVFSGSGPVNDYDTAGQTLSYSYLVTNLNGVAQPGPVTINDPNAVTTLDPCPDLSTIGNGDGNLDPGESVTCTGSYTVLPADLTNGSFTNFATATAGALTTPLHNTTLYYADPDLPGALENIETIPVGSLIIPMDTVSQAVGGSTDFNILVYGLANRMLQNDIPLKWAMRYDKVKIRGTASIDADPGTTLTDNNVGTDFTTGVEVGDLVINVSDGFTRAWVTAVVDANNLSLSLVDPGLTWSDGDEYVIDGHDFMATAEQIEPNCPDPDPLVCAPAALMNFAGGPFIISSEDPANIATALPLIAGYIAGTNSGGLGGDVNVFQTTVAADVDVRYTLRHRPFIAISDVNTGIHSKIMEAAGIPGSDEKDIPDNCAPPGDPAWDPDTCNWNQVVPVNLAALSCATIHFEPHRDKPNGEDEIPPVVDAVEAFVRNGGNFSAQCHAVQYFENLDEDTPDPLTYSGRFLTTVGILENGLGDDELDYPNAPMPFSQFTGPLEGGIGGSVPDWTLNTGAYKNKGHVHALNIPDNEDTHQAASGKLLGGAYSGGNIFYLGGHDYSGGDLDSINGVRMMLNTIFVPADRPTECGLNFGHPEMTIKKSSLTVEVTAAGQVVDYSYLVTAGRDLSCDHTGSG
jgi:hypothetical protein